jgi:hypothetical protein
MKIINFISIEHINNHIILDIFLNIVEHHKLGFLISSDIILVILDNI